ncbi:DUF962 domain-containing protein [Shewanella sp. 202IG2-18]|uniref:Mpo1 family 2-hydroxy fatty acid dioxygenase n=1 Tax=Parashewanella hymeniacidonis TaxID=2807618 RepID=UPI0019605324|nr:Mpo1-like protein [Parashewanella hymeniacidonis]MBM7074021.1 DUF962 domain-containing protein [Parashewanella hymeniacidonis]
MKTIVEQLSTYKSVHLDADNIKTHFIGVPTIIWSIFVWFSLLRFPIGDTGYEITFGYTFAAIVLVYYVMLHKGLALGMVLFMAPVMYTADLVAQTQYGGWFALAVFVVGWVFQLVGHKFEKAKPAFIDDLNQLLIGPLFLMAEVCFALGLLKSLNNEITGKAIAIRQQFDDAKSQRVSL